ncbi:MAG TPA: zinc-binding dehydrogenase [Candidatus Limnocylindria bacterium]|nr:zinc-binding dehydrogenase [Candidatus Limnocylindria bacterium]
MKAFQLVSHGKPGKFERRDVPEPKPGAGEVVVEVRACGLNRLDLWLEEAGLPVPVSLPRTPGGEVAGVIRELGERAPGILLGPHSGNVGNEGSLESSSATEPGRMPGARSWRVGDRVAIQSNLFCGECEFCRRGEESLCLRNELLGVQRDGGFAEHVMVPASSLVRLPDAVSFETSAALTLAGSTAMHMLTERTHVKKGDWVLAIGGASGVGSAAIQIAKELGARVISTASSEAKKTLAHQLGAEFVVDSNDPKWPAEVRRITGKRGVDIVVEHVGGEVLMRCFDCLARGGTIVTCGATAGREVTLNLWPFFVKQQRLIGSYGRNRADLRATLDWAAAGKLKPVIHATLPLARATEAFAALRERKVLGKIVINNQ